jgi:hypothetical protein
MKRLMTIFMLVSSVQRLHAGSAIWNSSPTSNDWDTATNWTPATIPYSETDVATFGASNVTSSVRLGAAPDDFDASNIVGSIVFTEGAPSYTITVAPVFDVIFPSILEFYGAGITNNSGVVQNFYAPPSGDGSESGRFYFNNSSSAGENVVITNQGGDSATPDGDYGGFTSLEDTSTAGKATFVNNGGTVSGARGGFTDLLFSCNADNATFICNPGEVSGALAAWTLVQTLGNIGSSTFIGNPATVAGAEGGWVEIDYATAAGANFIANGATTAGPQAGQIYVYGGDGYAIFTGNGGQGSGAEGGLIDLFGLSPSNQTIVIAKGGTNGGLGGNIVIEGDPALDLGQFQVFGDGLLDLSRAANGIVIGSLAGDGMVSLGGYSLSIGNNNLSTIFSGVSSTVGESRSWAAGP